METFTSLPEALHPPAPVPPPPADNEPYTNQEDFSIGMYELHRAYSAFSAATGPSASRPLLAECVSLAVRLAWSLEAAEAEYANTPGRLPYVNQRQEFLIGSLLSDLMDSDEVPEEVVVGLLLSADLEAQTAAARLLVASAPLYSDKIPPPIYHALREESAFERLIEWVSVLPAEEGAADPCRQALLAFATGLLAVLLLDRDVADYVVRTSVPTALLQHLHTAPQSFDGEGSQARLPAFLRGLSPQEMSRRAVLYRLSCLTAMGEYQEILAPFFQEKGVDIVLRGLERGEPGCLLAAIELTSRLLAHKKFAMTFVQEAAGVEHLITLSEGPQAFQLHAALAMCLFGLASLANVMEEVCRLPPETFRRLISYAISLLQCPQEAVQKSIVLFFGMALAFRPVLHAFDASSGDQAPPSPSACSGLYSLLNLLRSGASSAGPANSFNAVHGTQRRGQLAHYTTLCLRHYLRVHLAIMAASAEAEAPPPAPGKRPRLNSQDMIAASVVPPSSFRPVEIDEGATETLLARVRSGALHLPPGWAPLRRLLHHRGLLILLNVVACSSTGRVGAAETAKFALDCLEMATLSPVAIFEACLVPVPEQERTGMQILLETASGQAQRDAEVMRGALRVLCNCLCPRPASLQPPHALSVAPDGLGEAFPGETQERPTGSAGTAPAPAQDLALDPTEEKTRCAVRRDLRSKDGIKVLVSLLRYRRCIQAADEIRMLAARALLGLAQEPAISQILEKMRVGLLLSEVVRAGPVLERAGTEHYANLRSAALQLIARVTGRPASAVSHSDAMDPASWKLEKAAIVTRTPITYDPEDLLHLIHDHLYAQGLHQAARVLEMEAGLRLPAPARPVEEDGDTGGLGIRDQEDFALGPIESARDFNLAFLSPDSAPAAKRAGDTADGEGDSCVGDGGGGVAGEANDGAHSASHESILGRAKSPESVRGGSPPSARFIKKPRLAGMCKANQGPGASAAVSTPEKTTCGGPATAPAPLRPTLAPTRVHSAPLASNPVANHTPLSRPSMRGFSDLTSPTLQRGPGMSFQAKASASNEPPVSLPPVVRRSSLGEKGLCLVDRSCAASIKPKTEGAVSSPLLTRSPPSEGNGVPGPEASGGTEATAASGAVTASEAPHHSPVPRSGRPYSAGLQIRRAPRGMSPHPSSLGRQAGIRPGRQTPSRSLIDLPSPFPSAYKLPPLPSSAGRCGPLPYVQQRLPPVSGSTTLDQIVVQYLRRQHEQCPNPICVLPPFSLALPHRCPEPYINSFAGAAHNISRRLHQRQVRPPWGGWKGPKHTRSLVYSRFRPWRSFRDESAHPLACSVFSKGSPGRLWAGTEDGCVHLFNLWTSDLERSWDCHAYRISSMAVSPFVARPLLLTSASEVTLENELQAETSLWAPDDLDTPYLTLPGLRAAVFDASGTRVAGLSKENVALIYDAEVGTLLRSLRVGSGGVGGGAAGTEGLDLPGGDGVRGGTRGSGAGEGGSGSGAEEDESAVGLSVGADAHHPSLRSQAPAHISGPRLASGALRSLNVSFSPAENHLVLCDGVLWDDREPSVVHRFDRLSHGGSNLGAFHPNGIDVLLDGTVWDLRTQSLRTMMPGVEQCAVKFSASGDVLYAYRPGGLDEADVNFRPSSKRARDLTCFQVGRGAWGAGPVWGKMTLVRSQRRKCQLHNAPCRPTVPSLSSATRPRSSTQPTTRQSTFRRWRGRCWTLPWTTWTCTCPWWRAPGLRWAPSRLTTRSAGCTRWDAGGPTRQIRTWTTRTLRMRRTTSGRGRRRKTTRAGPSSWRTRMMTRMRMGTRP